MKEKMIFRQRPSQGGSQLLINLRHQQHNSWQGSVQRLDNGETVNFRSALELMVLIEGVVGEQTTMHDNQERLRTWSKLKEVEDPDTKEQTG